MITFGAAIGQLLRSPVLTCRRTAPKFLCNGRPPRRWRRPARNAWSVLPEAVERRHEPGNSETRLPALRAGRDQIRPYLRKFPKRSASSLLPSRPAVAAEVNIY